MGRVTWLDSFHKTSTSNNATQIIVEELLKEVDRTRGITGLYWGIQDLIQAKISPVGIDVSEFWAWGQEEDGSRSKEGNEMLLREWR